MQRAVGDENQPPNPLLSQPLDYRPDSVPAKVIEYGFHECRTGPPIETAVNPPGLVVALVPPYNQLGCGAEIQIWKRDVLDASHGDDKRETTTRGHGILHGGRRHIAGQQSQGCLGVDWHDRLVGIEFGVVGADAL